MGSEQRTFNPSLRWPRFGRSPRRSPKRPVHKTDEVLVPHSVPNATSTPPRPPSCCRTPGSMSSSRQPLDSRGASSFPLPGAAPRLLVRQRRASSCVDRFLPSCVIPLDCVGIRLVERSRMPRPRLPRSPSNSRAVRGHFLGRSIIGSSPDAAELFRCAVGSRYLRLVPRFEPSVLRLRMLNHTGANRPELTAIEAGGLAAKSWHSPVRRRLARP